MLEASRLDGCGFFRQYWHVGLPVVRPALAFLGIFTFISVWNDYLWPLVVLVDPGEVTLQVALGQLNRTHDTDYGMLMAGTVLAVIPLLIVFLTGARKFIADPAKGVVRRLPVIQRMALYFRNEFSGKTELLYHRGQGVGERTGTDHLSV